MPLLNWKDYLQFQKQDKVAVTLLLFTIVVCCGTYVSVIFSTQAKMPCSQQEKQTFVQHTDSVYEAKLAKNIPVKLRDGNRIDINKANEAQLQTIPGIGPALASRIITHRNTVGSYTNLKQLKDVKGIKEKLFDKIEKYVYIREN